jgi:hypothetical protein
VQKLQHGCIDALSLIIKAELLQASCSSSASPNSTLQLLPLVLQQIEQPISTDSYRICCINIATSCARHLNGQVHAIRLLHNIVIERISYWYFERLFGAAVTGALLQLMFTLCYLLRADSQQHGAVYMRIATDSIKHLSSQVRTMAHVMFACRDIQLTGGQHKYHRSNTMVSSCLVHFWQHRTRTGSHLWTLVTQGSSYWTYKELQTWNVCQSAATWQYHC